jgi:hypothetical protein
VWSQICTISIDSIGQFFLIHFMRFGIFTFEVWFVFLDIEILYRFISCEFADKNFNIRTFGCVFRYYELAVYLRMTLILFHNFYSTIWGLQFSDLWENCQKTSSMQIQCMAYYMELGITTMNYMFYGNNDSFVLFHTISYLPLRTAGV